MALARKKYGFATNTNTLVVLLVCASPAGLEQAPRQARVGRVHTAIKHVKVRVLQPREEILRGNLFRKRGSLGL